MTCGCNVRSSQDSHDECRFNVRFRAIGAIRMIDCYEGAPSKTRYKPGKRRVTFDGPPPPVLGGGGCQPRDVRRRPVPPDTGDS